jgi:hypothetical protein
MEWKPINTVPLARDVEIAIIDSTDVHVVACPCRLTHHGWIAAGSCNGVNEDLSLTRYGEPKRFDTTHLRSRVCRRARRGRSSKQQLLPAATDAENYLAACPNKGPI